MVGREKRPDDAPKKWIQFKDKAFSLKSKSMYDITHDFFFTNPIPWEIGENEETPTMDKLFKEWVGEKYLPTLYEILAYCCYSDYPIQVLFLDGWKIPDVTSVSMPEPMNDLAEWKLLSDVELNELYMVYLLVLDYEGDLKVDCD